MNHNLNYRTMEESDSSNEIESAELEITNPPLNFIKRLRGHLKITNSDPTWEVSKKEILEELNKLANAQPFKDNKDSFALFTFTEEDLKNINSISYDKNWHKAFLNFLKHLNKLPDLIANPHFKIIHQFFKEAAAKKKIINNTKCVAIELYQSYHALDQQRTTSIPVLFKIIYYCENIILDTKYTKKFSCYIDYIALTSYLMEYTSREQLNNLENLSNLNLERQSQILNELSTYGWRLPAYFIIKGIVNHEEYYNLKNPNNFKLLNRKSLSVNTKTFLAFTEYILNKIKQNNYSALKENSAATEKVVFKSNKLEKMMKILIPIVCDPISLLANDNISTRVNLESSSPTIFHTNQRI